MPWLSHPPSSADSSPLDDTEVLERIALSGTSLSYVVPLRDGALGTTPLSHERPMIHLLKHDARPVTVAAIKLVSALARSVLRHRARSSSTEGREILIYLIISAIEAQLLISFLPLWLLTPGAVFLPWICLQLFIIWLLLNQINGAGHILTRAPDRQDDEEEPTSDRDKRLCWIVVGGMDITHERMRRSTLPRLATLFAHDINVLLPYRLGFPLEIIVLLIRRSLHIPTATSTTLYGLVRTNLLRPHITGVRVLAHNTGALDTAWMVSRLYADLPSQKVHGKLEVFTFGAASVEMTTPLSNTGESHDAKDARAPAITHFAFESDPFATIGVLLGIRQRLEGRYTGGLFVIGTDASQRYRWTLDDYLEALFPGGDPRAGVLGQTCRIDRETSEMRELAALAQSVSNVQLRMQKGSKRLSWTALGAVASKTPDGGHFQDASMDGALSLEETRRLGKVLQGMKGYRHNSLAAAVRGPYRLSADETAPVFEGL